MTQRNVAMMTEDASYAPGVMIVIDVPPRLLVITGPAMLIGTTQLALSSLSVEKFFELLRSETVLLFEPGITLTL